VSAAVRFVAQLIAGVGTFVAFMIMRPSAPFELPWIGAVLVALCVAALVGLSFNLKVRR
jgi:hypothetical protein